MGVRKSNRKKERNGPTKTFSELIMTHSIKERNPIFSTSCSLFLYFLVALWYKIYRLSSQSCPSRYPISEVNVQPDQQLYFTMDPPGGNARREKRKLKIWLQCHSYSMGMQFARDGSLATFLYCSWVAMICQISQINLVKRKRSKGNIHL